ncbi:class I SAM-dependent methyltransferase [Microbulbifer agarilyticus]|uniref:class I SAM-dependent methyltransferase n=1 Tax=Microbulbifer agarilyticus TaxID=260552 RepID=UPI001CD6BBDB|nr:methyltransferase [Microbulbifer agarilyticus]MCA0893727.1 methyltransferase [Microbulbifer agarilyticus]
MSTLLSQLLSNSDNDTLWIADENSKALLTAGLQFRGTLLSNRWDIVHAAEQICISALFSDFDLPAIEKTFSRIVYPVSKEKAAVHHVINTAAERLQEYGELILIGSKNSGIKTYAQKAAQKFGGGKSLQKHGTEYSSHNQLNRDATLGVALDDSDYRALRKLDSLNGLFSKPGLFGWNKIDVGSALLARHFSEHLPKTPFNALDLGCGFGYLSVRLAQLAPDAHIVATDNNAAALLACQNNFDLHGIKGEVIAGDAGSQVASTSVDIVICNPPFHQGFQVEGDLTDRFLADAARTLKSGGSALFVVNEFIPLARKTEGLFREVTLLEKAKGFCVFRLTK